MIILKQPLKDLQKRLDALNIRYLVQDYPVPTELEVGFLCVCNSDILELPSYENPSCTASFNSSEEITVLRTAYWDRELRQYKFDSFRANSDDDLDRFVCFVAEKYIPRRKG